MRVTIDEWNQLAQNTMALALSLSPRVPGVYLSQLAGPDTGEELRQLHRAMARDVADPARYSDFEPPELIVVAARYRVIHQPVLQVVRHLEEEFPGRAVAMLMPEPVKQHC